MSFAAPGDNALGYRENGHNRLAGTVLRQVYLGESRDYLIDLGQTQIRVSAPPSEDRSVGSTVHLDVAVEAAYLGGRRTLARSYPVKARRWSCLG